jgi:hypothetical protein
LMLIHVYANSDNMYEYKMHPYFRDARMWKGYILELMRYGIYPTVRCFDVVVQGNERLPNWGW